MKEQTPAQIIHGQLGRQALAMMGAKDIFSDDNGNSLIFKIRGCRKINCIKIAYDQGSDLYNMQFLKCSLKAPHLKQVKVLDGVYVDMMHEIIEETTGLYLSL